MKIEITTFIIVRLIWSEYMNREEYICKGDSICSRYLNPISILFFDEKSILYVKITGSTKFFLSKLSFKYYNRPFIFIVTIMSQILINV